VLAFTSSILPALNPPQINLSEQYMYFYQPFNVSNFHALPIIHSCIFFYFRTGHTLKTYLLLFFLISFNFSVLFYILWVLLYPTFFFCFLSYATLLHFLLVSLFCVTNQSTTMSMFIVAKIFLSISFSSLTKTLLSFSYPCVLF